MNDHATESIAPKSADPSIGEIRARFPALTATSEALLDNAGGSQVPATVADAISRYMTTNYVQLGADYETSKRCTETVARAHEFMELFVGGAGVGGVILGGSMTAQCNVLADCVARAENGARDQIVISELAHESNAGPWARLSRRGFEIREWKLDRESRSMRLEDLRTLVTDRTRIVAVPQVSNIFGAIEDVAGAIGIAHDAGAEAVIDGVAYAPHRVPDVATLGADWYQVATYKVFGPHMGALFGTHDAMDRLPSAYHDFIPRSTGAYRFEPGGANHEGCAGLVGFWEYLAFLGAGDPHASPSRDVIDRAFGVIEALETELQSRAIDGLAQLPGVRLVGTPSASGSDRVSTISFVHQTQRSRDIAVALNQKGYGVRYGNFYSRRMAERLAEWGDIHDVDDGVVRISMVHYNTTEEVDGLLRSLAEIVGA